jgi:cell division protein FtsQ
LRRVLAGVGMALAAGAVGAAVWLVAWSDLTALDELRVDGVDGDLVDTVSATADPPFGTPLIRIDTGAIEEAVAELPDVAEVSVHRSWPAAITVTVTPRVAAAAIAAGESWWLVDDTGVLFGEGAEQPDGLPELDAPVDAEAGPARAAGVAVLTGLPAELHDLVVAVAAPTEASVELTLDSGATVLWGTADQLERKAAVLLALLPEEGSHYDVSAPGNPAVRP